MFDNHIHSEFSFDVPKEQDASVRAICVLAIAKGLKGVAITDHYDTDAIRDGFFPPLDHEGIKNAVAEAKDEFKGRLTVQYGIELGQAPHMPEKTLELLGEYNYDIVLGSVHGVRGIVDFADTDIKSLGKDGYIKLWEQYLSELSETIKFGQLDVLTHLTYPKRYYLTGGITDFPDLKTNGREYFEPILKEIIDKGIALECNTSGLRQKIGECLPNFDLLKFYYELGGRDISLGSDSHLTEHISSGFEDAIKMLREIGFKYTVWFDSRKKQYETL